VEGPDRKFHKSVGPALHVFAPRRGERHQGRTVLALGSELCEVSKEDTCLTLAPFSPYLNCSEVPWARITRKTYGSKECIDEAIYEHAQKREHRADDRPHRKVEDQLPFPV